MHAKRSPSVLTVDDDRTMLRLLRTLLKQMDIVDVEQVTDGSEALERLGGRRFDLVISDWHMRLMSGLELLGYIRRDPRLARLPFIMVTAECAPDRVADAERAGVSGYVVKPFEAETLKARIRASCAYG